MYNENIHKFTHNGGSSYTIELDMLLQTLVFKCTRL